MKITFCCANTPPKPWIQGLQAALPQANIQVWQPGAPSADFAVVWAPPQQFLDEQSGLRAIFNIGAGVDGLLQLQPPKQAQIIRLDDAGMAVQMAEYVTQAVIRHFRGLNQYETDTRQQLWQRREPALREAFPVGIMGLGVLGERAAQALHSFEFPVRGWSQSSKHIDGIRIFSGDAEFSAFLQGTRVLVNLLPLTAKTRDILNHTTLTQLLPGAYIINVARGAHLVDEDLLALIDSGHIAGATLDVFRQEPLPAEHPFWRMPQITMTPHISAITLREESIAQIAQKIVTIQNGETVSGIVALERGY